MAGELSSQISEELVHTSKTRRGIRVTAESALEAGGTWAIYDGAENGRFGEALLGMVAIGVATPGLLYDTVGAMLKLEHIYDIIWSGVRRSRRGGEQQRTNSSYRVEPYLPRFHSPSNVEKELASKKPASYTIVHLGGR